MYKVDIPLDTREAAAIARRKTAEAARKERIFNPKLRQYGRDLDALRLQVEEKRARDEQEHQRTVAYGQEMCRQDLAALEFGRRIAQDKVAVAQNVDEYRKVHQRYEDRREFDLNDVNIQKKTYPLRLHDEDPRCGPASLQRFEGEDLSYKQRIHAQHLQNRAWLDAQVKEKRMSQEDYDKAMEMYNQRMREMDLRSCQLWQAELEAQRAVNLANSEYNLALAYESQEKKDIERRAEDESAMAHIVNMCNSELLTETVDTFSVGGANRVARDRFKGYSAEQVAMVREEQGRQRAERLSREAEDRRTDAAWADLKRREDASTNLFDYDLQSRQRQRRVQTELTNMEMAREQRLRQEYLNRVLYRNVPSEEFYDQFNTTTR